MLVTRREGFSTAPITAGKLRPSSAKRARGTESAESSFDQITLSAQAGQEASPTFRSLAASLSQQVRTHNTTGKIQELRQEVRSGQYQISPRETAARMLLLEAEE